MVPRPKLHVLNILKKGVNASSADGKAMFCLKKLCKSFLSKRWLVVGMMMLDNP